MNVDATGAGGNLTFVTKSKVINMLQDFRNARELHPELLEAEEWAECAEQMMEGFLHESRFQGIHSIAGKGQDCPVCEESIAEWELDEDSSYIDPQDAVYFDDLSGKVLPEDLVQEARMEEIKFVDKIKLLEVVPRPSGVKVIGTRWVDVNKGDEEDYEVRSRLVGKEIKHKGTLEHYFAAMPPLAALKLLLSLAVTTVLPEKEAVYRRKGNYILQFLDVKPISGPWRKERFT